MKALKFEIQTRGVERDYRMIMLECDNKHEKVKLKSALMISPGRTHSLDLSVSSSLDKMKLVYKGWHREVVIDWREKPIRNNGVASYEFRLFYDDDLMGAGILNIKDQHTEVVFTGQHGRFSYLDFQFLSNRINDSSVNINIEGSSKPVLEESRCSFLIWNTTYTYNQNYGDPVLMIDSKQLLDTSIFEAECQDQPMYNSSSLGFSLLGRRKQPFQMSLNMDLKSELYPSGQLNVKTSLPPWNTLIIHSENYTKDNYIEGIEESSNPRVDNYLSIVTNYILKSDSFQDGTYAEIVFAPFNGTFKLQSKGKKLEIILDPASGKYLSISTNIFF